MIATGIETEIAIGIVMAAAVSTSELVAWGSASVIPADGRAFASTIEIRVSTR